MAKRSAKKKDSGRYRAGKIRLPKEEISPRFRKYTKPVGKSKRVVYAFVEVSAFTAGGSVFDNLKGDSVTIPVKIGRYTRNQLERLTRNQLSQTLRRVLPGNPVRRIAGFGHALTREERKGKRFNAPAVSRKTRKKGNHSGNRSAKKGSRKRGTRRRV